VSVSSNFFVKGSLDKGNYSRRRILDGVREYSITSYFPYPEQGIERISLQRVCILKAKPSDAERQKASSVIVEEERYNKLIERWGADSGGYVKGFGWLARPSPLDSGKPIKTWLPLEKEWASYAVWKDQLFYIDPRAMALLRVPPPQIIPFDASHQVAYSRAYENPKYKFPILEGEWGGVMDTSRGSPSAASHAHSFWDG
jgi:hypothetical protein